MSQTPRTLPLPWELAEAHNNRREENVARSKRYYLTKVERRKVWNESTHLFQLLRGDVPFGKPVELTGREAHVRNTKYEQEFIASKKEGARLWRLKWLRTLRNGAGVEVTPETCPITQNNIRKRAAKLAMKSSPRHGVPLSHPARTIRGSHKR